MNIEVTEFFLSKDLPYFYHECFPNPLNSEDKCPHFNYLDSVAKSLDKSDLIILACPVSTCDITTEMKLFLNHLSYNYMQNDTNSLMSNKIGLVMSTASGAGLFNTTKTLKKNLNFWGINNIFKFSKTLYEMNWEDVNLKTKKQINKKIFKLSNKILTLYSNSHPLKLQNFSKITSLKIQPMFKNNNFNVIDFKYWKNQAYFHIKN